jgi:alkanesulfonate monooxygenase SsuD/methylene tetrahydromethanopterin reductase-like flavin-dependent oxidoreductase (luciferase family)
MFGPYLATSVYNPFLAWCGYPEAAKAIDTAWRAKDRAANLAAVSDEMIDRIAIVGSAEHCRARVQEFAAAGVTTPMIHPFLFDEAAVWRTLEGLAPGRA